MSADTRTLGRTDPAAAERPLGWQQVLIFAGIVVVGLALRLFRLDHMGYWHDEVISTFAARAPAAAIFTTISANDTHPPGYHLLLHFWGALFGYELIPLRLFSVVTSLLCIPAVYLLGRELVGHRAGLLAAAMVALSPFQVIHAQQARMYPLLTLMVTLTTLAFVAAWRRGGVWRWALFGLAAAVGLYTQVYFAFSLVALNAWALYESVRVRRLEIRRWAGLIVAQAGAAGLFALFLSSLVTIASGVVASFWIRTSGPLDWLFGLVAITSYPNRMIGRAPDWYVLAVTVVGVAAIVASLAFVFHQAVRLHAADAPAWVLLALAALTPPLIGNALSMTVRPVLIDRSLIGATGPLYILLAVVAVRTWPHKLTQLLAPAVALTMAAGLAAVYPAAPTPHTLERATDAMFAERRPGDAVVVLDWQSFDVTALRHPGADDVFWVTDPAIVPANQHRMRFMGWHAPENAVWFESVPFRERYDRIWITETPYIYAEQWEAVEAWLGANARLVEERQVDEARLMLYELNP